MSEPLDINALRQRMAEERAALRREAGHASEMPAPAACAPTPSAAPSWPRPAAPIYTAPSDGIIAEPSAGEALAARWERSRPVLQFLHENWHILIAAAFALIGFASQTAPELVPGMGRSGGHGPVAGLLVGSIAFAMVFFGLRIFREIIRNAASVFDNAGERSLGYWFVAVVVFGLGMYWSLYGGLEQSPAIKSMMTPEAQAELDDLSRFTPRQWLWMVVKSLAMAMIAARVAENKLFSRP